MVGEIWVHGLYAMCAVTNEIRSFLSDKHNKLFKPYVGCKILEVQQISVLMLDLILFDEWTHFSLFCHLLCVCVFVCVLCLESL